MTWLDVGQPQHQANIVFSTQRLNRIIEHEPADLVAIAQAGVTLDAFNNALKQNGQWLPIDPPDDGRATLGGVVATGISGAQQFGYGPPRRHVIGMKVVTADGSLIKVGGRVVKNVAGYDLCKLFTGSYGTLGVIVEVNFKLRPVPFETCTVVLSGARDKLLEGGRRVIDSRLFPVAVELLSPALARKVEWSDGTDHVLLIRVAGTPNAVAHQTSRMLELLREDNREPSERLAPDEAKLWRSLAALPLQFPESLIWRVGLRPQDVGSFLARLDQTDSETMWQAGVGDGRIRVVDLLQKENGSQPMKGTIARIGAFRDQAEALGGSLIIELAPADIQNSVDAWGVFGSSLQLMQRVKRQLDPGGILSSGRFGFENALSNSHPALAG
jgi:FAD/FMN-containing dehydrogenase